MPRPPRDDGREAFNQDHSGKGPPAKSDRASSIEMSKTDMHPSGGQLGMGVGQTTPSGQTSRTARGLWAVSIWESCKSHSRSKMFCTFLTRRSTVASQKDEGQMGKPRRSKLSLAMGISAERGF